MIGRAEFGPVHVIVELVVEAETALVVAVVVVLRFIIVSFGSDGAERASAPGLGRLSLYLRGMPRRLPTRRYWWLPLTTPKWSASRRTRQAQRNSVRSRGYKPLVGAG